MNKRTKKKYKKHLKQYAIPTLKVIYFISIHYVIFSMLYNMYGNQLVFAQALNHLINVRGF